MNHPSTGALASRPQPDPQERSRTSLAELARTHAAASRVFHRYRFDFCCGGAQSLAEACSETGIDPMVVLQAIDAETHADSDVRWAERTPEEIIDHILAVYHAPLRPEVARLHAMAERVEKAHRDKPSRPVGLAEHLSVMAQAIEDHLAKEEQILFPMIRSGKFGLARMPIQMMVQEHDDHGAALRRTRLLTNDLRFPPEACTTWRALYLGLDQLERDLHDHIHLENNVLFPMVLNGRGAAS